MLDFYNQQVDLFVTLNSNDKNDITKIIDNNPSKISWTRSLKKDLYNKKKHNKNVDSYRLANYRPFCKQNLYYDKSLIESPGLNIQYFPEKLSHNRIISIPGVGGSKEFTTLMTDSVTDYQVMFNNQCFPLFYYEVKQQVYWIISLVGVFMLAQAFDVFGEELLPVLFAASVAITFPHVYLIRQLLSTAPKQGVADTSKK